MKYSSSNKSIQEKIKQEISAAQDQLLNVSPKAKNAFRIKPYQMGGEKMKDIVKRRKGKQCKINIQY